MEKVCIFSWEEFEITESDIKFYEKVWVPIPSLFPKERQRRRQAVVNLNNLYYREDWSKTKKIISPFSSDKHVNVVPFEEWFSDRIDAKAFGRKFDFTKSFFLNFLNRW